VGEISESERKSIIIAQDGIVRFAISSSVLNPQFVKSTDVENRGQIWNFL